MENQLMKVGMPHSDNLNFAPLLRKFQQIQLSLPSKWGQYQQVPLSIGLKSEFPPPR